MTKTEKQTCKSAHHKIFKQLTNYVLGPKFNNKAKYQIGNLKSKVNTLGIIAVDAGWARCQMQIYFYNTKIHIYISQKDPDYGCINKTDWTYTDFEKQSLPESFEDYIVQTNTFLQELLKHCSYVHNSPYGTTTTSNLNNYQACAPDIIPDDFDVPFGLYEALSYHYNSSDAKTVSIMTNIFKSKAYKRYRGDNI